MFLRSFIFSDRQVSAEWHIIIRRDFEKNKPISGLSVKKHGQSNAPRPENPQVDDIVVQKHNKKDKIIHLQIHVSWL